MRANLYGALLAAGGLMLPGLSAADTNIELILDASGSMWGDVGEMTKIEAAQQALREVIDSLPADNDNLNVGFRVYGHRGDNTEAMKELSCQSTELLVPIPGIDKSRLIAEIDEVNPVGWTPTALALEQAALDFPEGLDERNIIVLVTDGKETCDRDPCAVARAMAELDPPVRIDVVGFDVTPETANTLACIPDSTAGNFYPAGDGQVLASTLREIVDKEIELLLVPAPEVVAVEMEPAPMDLDPEVAETEPQPAPEVELETVDPEAPQLGTLEITAIGADGETLDEDHRWNQVLVITGIENENGQVVALSDSSQGLIDMGMEEVVLEPGIYHLMVEQQLGGPDLLSFTAPEANNRQRVMASVRPNGASEVVIGPGSLHVVNRLEDPGFSCRLTLEVEMNGNWEAVHPAPPANLCHAVDGELYGMENGFWLDEDHPLMPGTYRLMDTRTDRVIADNIEIDSGGRVAMELTTGPAVATTQQ